MGEFSCCIADELVLVPPRRHRLKLASPGRYSLCRSTRPGCEQRSAPAGSIGEFSCCIADELVLVPPGLALPRVGLARVRYTPGEHGPWGEPVHGRWSGRSRGEVAGRTTGRGCVPPRASAG